VYEIVSTTDKIRIIQERWDFIEIYFNINEHHFSYWKMSVVSQVQCHEVDASSNHYDAPTEVNKGVLVSGKTTYKITALSVLQSILTNVTINKQCYYCSTYYKGRLNTGPLRLTDC
jgi:hypothetical protein